MLSTIHPSVDIFFRAMLTTESHASGVGKLLSSSTSVKSHNSSCSLNCDDIPGYVEKSMSSIDTTEKSNWTSISSVEFEVFDEEDAKSVDIHEDKALLPRFDQCSQKELRELLIERLNVDFTDKSSTFPSFRRDEVKEWGTGYVTHPEPLEVTVEDDPKDSGWRWTSDTEI